MGDLTSIEAGGYRLDFGVASTEDERRDVLAQRLRVYRRQGYYYEKLTEDQNEYDRQAMFSLGRLRAPTIERESQWGEPQSPWHSHGGRSCRGSEARPRPLSVGDR